MEIAELSLTGVLKVIFGTEEEEKKEKGESNLDLPCKYTWNKQNETTLLIP